VVYRFILALNPAPRLKPFSTLQFLTFLQQDRGFSKKKIGLYKSFMESSNGKLWLTEHKKQASQQLFDIYLRALCNADINELIDGKTEVEVVDLFLRVSRIVIDKGPQLKKTLYKSLQAKLSEIISALPAEIQTAVATT